MNSPPPGKVVGKTFHATSHKYLIKGIERQKIKGFLCTNNHLSRAPFPFSFKRNRFLVCFWHLFQFESLFCCRPKTIKKHHHYHFTTVFFRPFFESIFQITTENEKWFFPRLRFWQSNNYRKRKLKGRKYHLKDVREERATRGRK